MLVVLQIVPLIRGLTVRYTLDYTSREKDLLQATADVSQARCDMAREDTGGEDVAFNAVAAGNPFVHPRAPQIRTPKVLLSPL